MDDKDRRGKSAPHARIEGARKDTDLPFIRKEEDRIPLSCIDPEWRRSHPEQIRPRRVRDWDMTDMDMDDGSGRDGAYYEDYDNAAIGVDNEGHGYEAEDGEMDVDQD